MGLKKTILSAALAFAPILLHPIAAFGFDLPSDASAEEQAAYTVLEKHCARCHQDGNLKPGLDQPKEGFGHVLDLRRLAGDKNFVVPGDASKSYLWQVMGEFGIPAMPDDCTESACFPDDAEIQKVTDWINGIKVEEEKRAFVSLEQLHQAALADLQKQPANRHDQIRYFSLRVIHNDPEVKEKDRVGYRAALIKLLNSLSFNPTIFKFVAVEENEVLVRVFLPELNWSHDTWALLEAQYPFILDSETDTSLKDLKFKTGARMPILRADWLAATASVSPLYYDVLGLPDTFQGLERLLNIDMNANIRNEQVVRSGFQDSGVSTHNRMIERHALGSGFFWTSYDFAGSKGRQNFFEFPLGPKEALGDELAFLHDGGETIFTLPNGFHGYYLNTAEGGRLDRGPTEIVRDDDYHDGTGEVINGISCMSCHSKGIRKNKDAVRLSAVNNRAFSASQRQKIDALYPGDDVVQDLLAKDEAAFLQTLKNADIDPTTEIGGREPIRGLFIYFEDDFVDFAQAANELGLTEEELTARLPFVGTELAGLMGRLNQSPIARDEWVSVYPSLLERVTDYFVVPTDHSHAQGHALPASIKNAARHDNAIPHKIVSRPTTRRDTKLTLYTDKQTYVLGDPIKIFIEPRRDCRLTLVNIDDDGDSCTLFPHPQLDDNIVRAGTQYIFPPFGAMRASEVGFETILAVCNAAPGALDTELRDTSKVSCDVNHAGHSGHESGHEDLFEVFSLDLREDDAGQTKGKLTSRDILRARIDVEVVER